MEEKKKVKEEAEAFRMLRADIEPTKHRHDVKDDAPQSDAVHSDDTCHD